MRALIVDDSRVVRRYLSAMMHSLGWETEEVDGGARAMQLLRKDDRFELLLIDIHMPGMSGVECVQAVRRELAMLEAKLMVVSTEKSFAMIGEALASGADEFLMKPFTRENLLAKLQLLYLTNKG